MGFSRQEYWRGLPFPSPKCEWGLPKLWSRRCCYCLTTPPPPPWWLLSCWGGGMQEAAICYFLKWTRKQYLAPDNWGAYEKNEFSEPRGLHLSTHRMLNSLTWHLISDAQTACSLCCKLLYSLTSSPAFLEQFSQSYWDAVSLSSSPKLYHLIKINLYLQVITIFFSRYA